MENDLKSGCGPLPTAEVPGLNASFLLTGFVPWQEDCPGWVQSIKETFSGEDRSRLVRTVWTNTIEKGETVLVDAYRTASRDQAKDYLGRLATNSMVRLSPESPQVLDVRSLLQPGEVPRYASRATGNICLVVSSLGRIDVDAKKWADRLETRMREMPNTQQLLLCLTPAACSIHVGDEVSVDYSLPWQLGDTGYFKFFAFGGQLRLEMERLSFRAGAAGEALIIGFAVESGHQPYRGELAMEIKARSHS